MTRTLLLLALSCFMFIGYNLNAKEIYKWKEGDKTYFTDNLDDVPFEFRENGKRELKNRWSRRDEEAIIQAGKEKDKAVWEMQCASCHTTGIGFVEGKIGLLDYVQNLDTGMAISAPNVIKSLRKATQGRTTDMRPMNLLDEELTAITRYLMTFQKGL
jgi:hypothetical protein